MKLWEKGYNTDILIEKFTIGKDQELDLELANFDILGSIAHAKMLNKIGILTDQELSDIQKELVRIYYSIDENFKIETEDIHSKIEFLLTEKLGDLGKKIHTGRSRNDQVLLDLHLFGRSKIQEILKDVQSLFELLLKLSEKHKNVLLPGYTHLQVAMPSSFGLWFSAYAESLCDDVKILLTAFQTLNQNPLGSAAGYGSSIPIDRKLTTELLGFDDLIYSSAYAQMTRSKTEKTVCFALASVASTLGKMANDICLYMNQNFGFIRFPDELTTGSSIMPHKKNPDVFELIRAKTNNLQSLPYRISQIGTNLPSGYFRDFQQLKEMYIPAFGSLKEILITMIYSLNQIEVNENILDEEIYDSIFSVEIVNKLVAKGIPFRDAYKQVADNIQNNQNKTIKDIHHTHEGSIGNLCLNEIRNKMDTTITQFEFDKIEKAFKNLLDIN